MGMYNAIFGYNIYAPFLVDSLALSAPDFKRLQKLETHAAEAERITKEKP